MTSEQKLTFIGHPYANIGKGEELRSAARAADSCHIDLNIYDIFKYSARTDPDHLSFGSNLEVESVDDGIRVFHVNGDEVERVIDAFNADGCDFEQGYNVIVPAWELPRYPSIWKNGLKLFDEVWAISKFVESGLKATGIDSQYIGQSVEVPCVPFLSRSFFGIRHSSFVLLHFLDLSSYATRKNPEAVIELYRSIRRERPYDDIQLVLKVKNGESAGDSWIEPFAREFPEVIFMEKPLSTYETKKLDICLRLFCFPSPS